MFERFTPQARDVVVSAQQEARQLRHHYIGTEHVLLGLLRDDGSAGPALREAGLEITEVRRQIRMMVDGELDEEALSSVGIDLDQVRRAVEASFGPGALDSPRSRKEP